MIFEWATGGKCRGGNRKIPGVGDNPRPLHLLGCVAREERKSKTTWGIAWTGTGARSEVGPGVRKWRNQDDKDWAMGTGLTASGPMGRQDTSVQGSEEAIDFSCASYVRRLAIPSSSP